MIWQNSINKFGPGRTSSNNSNLRPLLKVATSTSMRGTQMETEPRNIDESKANIPISTCGATSSINQNLMPINVTESLAVKKSLGTPISSDSSSINGKKVYSLHQIIFMYLVSQKAWCCLPFTLAVAKLCQLHYCEWL